MDNVDKEKIETIKNKTLTRDVAIQHVEWLINLIEKQDNEIERYRSELSDIISFLETSDSDSGREYADKFRALLNNDY